MEFITIEQLNDNLGNKSKIELVDLIQVIEEQFGYKVSISRKFTEEQKRKMTNVIFSDEDVLRQLNESEFEPEGNDIESIEDYSRFMKEVGKSVAAEILANPELKQMIDGSREEIKQGLGMTTSELLDSLSPNDFR